MKLVIPPIVIARMIVDIAIRMAVFQPSSLPRTAKVAMHGK